jgi:hypothetical protein
VDQITNLAADGLLPIGQGIDVGVNTRVGGVWHDGSTIAWRGSRSRRSPSTAGLLPTAKYRAAQDLLVVAVAAGRPAPYRQVKIAL